MYGNLNKAGKEMEKDMSTDSRKIKITGTALPLRGNNIDTDRIIPARYLIEVTFSRMGEYPFYDERFDSEGKPKSHQFNDAKYRGASILFVNENFGCGSSREHAPQALHRYGICAIIGESYGAIFAGNCLMLGVPTIAVSSSEMEMLMKSVESVPETVFTVDLESKTVTCGEMRIPFDIPESFRNALMTGAWDSTSTLRANLGKVKGTSSRLPYMTGFKE
jgi:3-isopropylmalate/(R)-2-methylmalate dehydratase small subunit